jgi:hypothetical protein
MDLLEVIYRHVTLLEELQSMKSVMHVLDALFTDGIEAFSRTRLEFPTSMRHSVLKPSLVA